MTSAPQNLQSLCKQLNAINELVKQEHHRTADESDYLRHGNLNLTSLPVWGEGPENTIEIFSWERDVGGGLWVLQYNQLGHWEIELV